MHGYRHPEVVLDLDSRPQVKARAKPRSKEMACFSKDLRTSQLRKVSLAGLTIPLSNTNTGAISANALIGIIRGRGATEGRPYNCALLHDGYYCLMSESGDEVWTDE
jgi:hypothetical protein